ncbi:MAG: hypothetical protein IJF07_01055 [Lachnospiraceae bacterium]|nr:hypothetical protein [Lachnospiraceae bacterium]
MWEGSYGREPFDLRLTVLRLIREFGKILVLTIVGTILFGGGYYVKNMILRPEPTYAATSTYKVQYTVEPTKAGDYYINEASWNTLLKMKEFLDAVQVHLTEGAASEQNTIEITNEELKASISARLPSDWHVPTTTVKTNDPAKSVAIAAAVEKAMVKELAAYTDEVNTIRVMNPALEAKEVELDVRPARAFVLSAFLSFFFVTVLFLLKETGDDSIWLPTTLRRRYGLYVLGTINSVELAENTAFRFQGKKKVAICAIDGAVNTKEVAAALEKRLQDAELYSTENQPWEWIAVETPITAQGCCEKLRKMDSILLVVGAGPHTGKPLEYVLEYLAQQECEVSAAILWNADEVLLRGYYCLPQTRLQ